jgi:DNA invertase Pin-like site-specific DNA recombinase
LKCIAYIYVSTEEQTRRFRGRLLSNLLVGRSRGLKVCTDMEESSARSLMLKPGALQLLQKLKIKPECVGTWSINRLERILLDVLNAVLQELEGRR